MKLLHGVGINDGKYPMFIGGKNNKVSTRWRNMISRCYSVDRHKVQPTYADCTVSENFKSYSYFYEWHNDQACSNLDNFDLDKDILIKGNKIYSEDTCVFIPSDVNALLTSRHRFRGEFPLGVHFHKPLRKFRAQINKKGKRFHIGYFNTPDEAFIAYKIEKEKYIKEVANEYRYILDGRAYKALMEYGVDRMD